MRLQELRFVIRYPAFPVVCDFDGFLVAASSPGELTHRIAAVEVDPNGRYSIVSSTSQRWVLDVSSSMVLPSFGQQWTKAEVIRLFNGSRNVAQEGLSYPTKSLANRRFDRIVGEITALLDVLARDAELAAPGDAKKRRA